MGKKATMEDVLAAVRELHSQRLKSVDKRANDLMQHLYTYIATGQKDPALSALLELEKLLEIKPSGQDKQTHCSLFQQCPQFRQCRG